MSELKAVVFDLDDTLVCSTTHQVYVEVNEVLTKLQSIGYQLFVCSQNAHADEILVHHGLRHFFEGVFKLDQRFGYNVYSKIPMLQEIMYNHEFKPSELLLLDDLNENITDAKSIGIRGHRVDARTGITWSIIESLLPSSTY